MNARRGNGVGERARRTTEALAFFTAGFVVLFLGVGRPVNFFDEAWVLVGGERVLSGELPYRDFYALYPPGQYFTVAGLFATFGAGAMTVRVYCIAVRAAIALVLYLTARRLAGRALAALAWAQSLLWLTACGSFGYPVFPALLLVLAAMTALAACADAAARGAPVRPSRLAAAGAAVGAAALFRHDIGAYGLAACAPLVLLLGVRRTAAPFVAGAVVAFGVPAAWMLVRAPLDAVIFQLFTYPATGYSAMRGHPYPRLFEESFSAAMLASPRLVAANLANLPYYAPIAFAVAALAGVAWRARSRRDRPLDTDAALLASVAVLCLGAMNLARVRCTSIQVCAAAIVSFVVAAAIVRRTWDRGGARARGAAIATAFVATLMLIWPAHALRSVPMTGPVSCEPDPLRVAHLETGSARREVAEYLRSVVPSGGRVFVACGRHDKVFVNEPIIYFMAGRLPGSRYHAFDPGVITTLAVQEEVVRDLERNRVAYVVVSTEFDDWIEPNESAVPSGVTVLDEYLRANYALDRRFNEPMSVWKRRTAWEGAK